MLIGMFGTGSRDLDRVIRNAFANDEDGIWVAPRLGGMYQDAALTTPWTADGQAVGGYVDRSPRGYVLTQPTAPARPLGYSDRLDSDGADDYLSGGNILPIRTGSYFASSVITHVASGSTQYFAGMSGGNGRYAEGVSNNDAYFAIFNNGTSYSAFAINHVTQKSVVSTVFDRVGKTLTVRMNGVQERVTALPEDTTDWQPSGNFVILAFPGISLFFHGALHERVQVMRNPIAGEVEAIEARLATVHGI